MDVNIDVPTSGDSATVSSLDQHSPSERCGHSGPDFAHGQLPSVNLAELVAVSFEPKEDITAYELALLLPCVVRGVSTAQEIETLGSARKHIRESRVGS